MSGVGGDCAIKRRRESSDVGIVLGVYKQRRRHPASVSECELELHYCGGVLGYQTSEATRGL